MAQAISGLSKCLGTLKLGKGIGPRASFEGAPHEDPRMFLEEMYRHFLETDVTNTYDRVALTLDRLKGGAARWAVKFKFFRVEFSQFERRFLEQFDGQHVLVELTTKLYSEKQGSREGTEEFIAKKKDWLHESVDFQC